MIHNVDPSLLLVTAAWGMLLDLSVEQLLHHAQQEQHTEEGKAQEHNDDQFGISPLLTTALAQFASV